MTIKIRNHFIKCFYLMVASLFLLACQTNQLKQFNTLQNGMDKDTVLESMGTPYSNVRSKGIDKWTYVFYDQQNRYEKEVHFKSGNVIYIGEPVATKEPAAAADAKIAAQDTQEELELSKRKEENKKAFSNYEEETKSSKKVKYAPTYTPIQ